MFDVMVIADMFASGFNGTLLSVIIAIGFLLVGIFLGGFISYLIKKVMKGTDIEKDIRPSFVGLIATVIKWAIYIVFFDLALKQLPFTFLGDFFGKILLIIPAFIGALVLIGIGFAIAIYLRSTVEESEISGWKALSQYLYYFVLYVFGVYALNLALITIDKVVRNSITIALTAIVVAALTYVIVKKEVGKR